MSMVMSIMRMTMSFEVAYHRPMSLWQVDAQWLLKQKQRQSKASADPFTLHVPIQYILREYHINICIYRRDSTLPSLDNKQNTCFGEPYLPKYTQHAKP